MFNTACFFFVFFLISIEHNDVIKWKHFPRYCVFVRRIHRSPVNSPHKGQWRGALMFSLIWALNKRLSKQSWGWWFETPSRSLWRHCSDFGLGDDVKWCVLLGPSQWSMRNTTAHNDARPSAGKATTLKFDILFYYNYFPLTINDFW